MPTNEEREKAASHAIFVYRNYKDGNPKDSPVQQSHITALLTDLRHYCREHQLCFDNAARISEYHFIEERGARE